MKTFSSALLRTLGVSSLMFMAPIWLPAAPDAASDAAARQLAAIGMLPVSAVGPYVEVGTFQIQVAVKLGRPDARLSDGSWMYHDRSLANSSTRGTVVIRFADRKVSRIAFVTPATATALLQGRSRDEGARVASKS